MEPPISIPISEKVLFVYKFGSEKVSYHTPPSDIGAIEVGSKAKIQTFLRKTMIRSGAQLSYEAWKTNLMPNSRSTNHILQGDTRLYEDNLCAFSRFQLTAFIPFVRLLGFDHISLYKPIQI